MFWQSIDLISSNCSNNHRWPTRSYHKLIFWLLDTFFSLHCMWFHHIPLALILKISKIDPYHRYLTGFPRVKFLGKVVHWVSNVFDLMFSRPILELQWKRLFFLWVLAKKDQHSFNYKNFWDFNWIIIGKDCWQSFNRR